MFYMIYNFDLPYG